MLLQSLRSMTFGLLCLAFLGTGALADHTDKGEILHGDEIAAALISSVTQGVNEYGNPYTVWFLPNGRLDGIAGETVYWLNHLDQVTRQKIYTAPQWSR